MVRRLMLLILVGLVIASCGSGGDDVTSVPTVTPMPEDPNANATDPSATQVQPTLEVSQDYQNGLTALENKDYLAAIDALTLAHANQRDNQEVGDKLAEAYHLYGLALLAEAGADANKVREAFDAFTSGQQAAPPSGQMYGVLEADLRQVTAFIEGQGSLENLAELGEDDVAARKEAAEKAYEQLGIIKNNTDIFPTVADLYFDALLAMADVRELEAINTDETEARKALFTEAKGFCEQARAQAGDNEAQQSASDECTKRLENRINPPTTVPTDTPKPATPKPVATPANGPKSFRGYIATGFQPGEDTGQFSSCISGKVVFADGSPVASAVGNVNNGGTPREWIADAGGIFNVCGLGFSNWAVVLYYIPGPGLANNVSIPGIWLNGSGEQSAFVVFEGR